MSKKILVAFGDSYGAGAELFNEGWTIGSVQSPHDNLNFVQLLGQEFDLCYNFSTVGSSIPGYIEQLARFNKFYNSSNKYYFLVMLTQHNRDYVYDNALGWTNLYPGISYADESYTTIEHKWYDNVEYPQTAHLNWYRTIALLQSYARERNITDYYIEQFNPSPKTHYDFLIDRSKIYTTPLIKEIFFNDGNDSVGTLNWKQFKETKNYNKFYAPRHHPNEHGHILLAQKIKQLTMF